MSENITDKNTLKSYFKRGLKPTALQFAAWMDSYWHKNEPIPTATIQGLETILNSKAETADITSIRAGMEEHAKDDSRHKTAAEQSKLDNLAENADATYATKAELEANGAIIIPVDFTNPELDLEGYITTFVQPFFEDGSFFKKPVYANFIWKTDYTEGAKNVDRSVLIPSTAFQSIRTFGYCFRQPVDVLDSYNNEIVKYELEVTYLYTKPTVPRVYINNYSYDSDRTIFLQENGDGYIATQELYWGEFHKALQNKLNPTIYLKTNNTDVYIPAAYNFVKDPERTIGFIGDIQISYLKNVNGENQLWTENRKFTSALGGFIGSSSTYELPVGGFIQKIPLGGNPKPYIIRCTFPDNTTGTGSVNTDDFNAYYNAVIEGMDSANVLINYNEMLFKTASVVVLPGNGVLMTASQILAGKEKGISSGHSTSADSINAIALKLSASLSDGTWSALVHRDVVDVKTFDYLKVSNINIVSEYPSDLSAYPDGSIFIKQQAS